jgi:putative transposase
MKKEYRRTATTVSMVNYHFVFCPRYRRKIFLIDGVEPRFKELVHQICEQNDIVILALECHIDHCHLFVNCPPNLSPADVMRLVKTNVAAALLREVKEFSRVQNLWTRSYFVSTAGDVSNATIQQYVESQKTR